VNLHTVDHARRTATYAISIGEPECWGKGYGTEATRLMLDYGFTALGLHNIMLTVLRHNEAGIRAYTRAGFREIGRRREAYPFAGQVYDIVMMDCLATEFESPVLRTRLSGGAPRQGD
jgi:RimJ/RimL family protein N-acetyltransferase